MAVDEVGFFFSQFKANSGIKFVTFDFGLAVTIPRYCGCFTFFLASLRFQKSVSKFQLEPYLQRASVPVPRGKPFEPIYRPDASSRVGRKKLLKVTPIKSE
jgi:hypothetical protein